MFGKTAVFKIIGTCTLDVGDIDAPCINYPEVCIDCLLDNCEYFVIDDYYEEKNEEEDDDFDA